MVHAYNIFGLSGAYLVGLQESSDFVIFLYTNEWLITIINFHVISIRRFISSYLLLLKY